MTRKDFELIADVLAVAGDVLDSDPDLTPKELWHGIVAGFATALSLTNPRFDQARFLKACGGVVVTTALVEWTDEWSKGYIATAAGGMFFRVEDDPEPIESWLGAPCGCGHDEHVGIVVECSNGTVLESLWGVCAFDDDGYTQHEYWREIAAQLAGCDGAT